MGCVVVSAVMVACVGAVVCVAVCCCCYLCDVLPVVCAVCVGVVVCFVVCDFIADGVDFVGVCVVVCVLLFVLELWVLVMFALVLLTFV